MSAERFKHSGGVKSEPLTTPRARTPQVLPRSVVISATIWMLSRRTDAAQPAHATASVAASTAPITQAVQVNVASPAALPRTIAGYIAGRAAELPQYSQAQLAAELGTSADTVRRALTIAAAAETVEQET